MMHTRCLFFALLVLSACKDGGGGEGGASTTDTTAAETGGAEGMTVDVPTDTGDETAAEVPTTGAGTTEGATSDTTGGSCESPHLRAQWVLPEGTNCFGVAMDDEGAITVLSGSASSDEYHAALIRLVDGAVVWMVEHAPASEYVRPYGLAQRGDGTALIVGFADDPGSFERLPWAAAYDREGALRFDHVDAGPGCVECFKGENHAVVVTSAGEFLATGAVADYMDFNFVTEAIVRRYGVDSQLSTTRFATPAQDGEDMAEAIAVRGDGTIAVAGRTVTDFNTADAWFARLAADGSFVDIRSVDIAKDDEPRGLVALDDGGVVFLAAAGDGNSTDYVHVAALDVDGTPLWQTKGTHVRARGLVGAADGALFSDFDDVAGPAKLGADGARVWAEDPCLRGSPPEALALTPDGAELMVCRYDGEAMVLEIYDPAS